MPLAVPAAIALLPLAFLHPVFALPVIAWAVLCLTFGVLVGLRAGGGFALLALGFVIPVLGFVCLSLGFVVLLMAFMVLVVGFVVLVRGFVVLGLGFVVSGLGFMVLGRPAKCSK